MTAYTVKNSRGNTVTTINVSTTTGDAFPVEMVGQGISLYGPIIAENQYHLLENFANTVAPINPVEGMFWYNVDIANPTFYNGTNYISVATATSSVGAVFDMLPASTGIDFTSTGSTVIFTAPNDGSKFFPTGIVLKPNGTPVITSDPVFNLKIDISEDVLDNTPLSNPAVNKHAYYSIEGTTRFASGSDSISLEVTTAAVGTLLYDVLLFGLTG